MKTSVMSWTGFQSTMFELSQRILSYGKMGSDRKKQKLFSFALHWLHILQCKSMSRREQRKTFNFRKIFNAVTLWILHIFGLDLRFLVLSYHYLKFQHLNTSKNLMINSSVVLKVNTGGSHGRNVFPLTGFLQ